MKCLKNGAEVDRPISNYSTEGVDPLDRTTWCNARPLPELHRGERVVWVDGDRRPHIIGGDDAAGEN